MLHIQNALYGSPAHLQDYRSTNTKVFYTRFTPIMFTPHFPEHTDAAMGEWRVKLRRTVTSSVITKTKQICC